MFNNTHNQGNITLQSLTFSYTSNLITFERTNVIYTNERTLSLLTHVYSLTNVIFFLSFFSSLPSPSSSLVDMLFPSKGLPHGTVFLPVSKANTINRKKRWILSFPLCGKVYVNQGAERALIRKGSLFAAGIKRIQGTFFSSTSCVCSCVVG